MTRIAQSQRNNRSLGEEFTEENFDGPFSASNRQWLEALLTLLMSV